MRHRLTATLVASAIAVAIAAAIVRAAPTPTSPHAPRPHPDGEAPASARWTRVAAGGYCACADGSAFAFHFRRGDVDRLLIHFDGGGACWSGSTCDPRQAPTYRRALGTDEEPEPRDGIYDLDNPENPFRDFSILHVPACTGDLQLGTRVVRYPARTNDGMRDTLIEVRHLGHYNATAALDWLRRRLPDPRLIVVAGSSDGAIAAPLYAGMVAQRWPGDTRIVQIGDGAGAYRTPAIPRLLGGWGALRLHSQPPDYAIRSATTFHPFAVVTARQHPRMQFAQVNHAADERQQRLLALLRAPDTTVSELLRRNHAELREAIPGFRTFTASGTGHATLDTPSLYTIAEDGVRLVDWVRRLVAGQAVSDVRCAECP
jgi:hypothetical protein